MQTLKRIWKKDYVQTAVMIAFTVTVVLGLWFGSQFVLRTQYPALAVVSGSMFPTLNVGDLIIVQGTSAADLNAHYITGDIIVYRNPYVVGEDLIVHRAVKTEFKDGVWIITTHGDNNPPGSEERFNETFLVGKVVARIPYVGNISLFTKSQGSTYFFVILAIITILVLLTIFETVGEKGTPSKKQKKNRKLFGKLGLETIYLIVLNILLVSFVFFNLWGSYTFSQPGAMVGFQTVTIRGTYPDVAYHETFKQGHNNITQASLSQGLLMYAINCRVSDGLHEGERLGVPTFSWAQVSIIILLIIDGYTLTKFLRSKKPKTNAETEPEETTEEPPET